MARQRARDRDEREDRLAPAWRRLIQAEEALETADEAEDFQAVGMRCREALLAMTRGIANEAMVPAGKEHPQKGNFLQWAELIANAIAAGPSADQVRGLLKAIAKSTWQLVSWLTHATNAVRFDGRLAIDATESTLAAFSAALIRYERGTPDRCPVCSSYRITSIHVPELGIDPPYTAACESCGWRSVGEESTLKKKLESTKDQLESALEELARFHGPTCAAPLSETRTVVHEYGDDLIEIFECGYESGGSRPCPSDPNFPKIDEYDFRTECHPEERKWKWTCFAVPLTSMARRVGILSGTGETEEKAKMMVQDRYIRAARPWRAAAD